MRTLSIAAMQTAPIARDPDATLDLLAKQAPAVMATVPHAQLLVLPELHLSALPEPLDESDGYADSVAVSLPGPLTERLGEIARASKLDRRRLGLRALRRGPHPQHRGRRLSEGRARRSLPQGLPLASDRALRSGRRLRHLRHSGRLPARPGDLLRRLVSRGDPPARLARSGGGDPAHAHADLRPRGRADRRSGQRDLQPALRRQRQRRAAGGAGAKPGRGPRGTGASPGRGGGGAARPTCSISMPWSGCGASASLACRGCGSSSTHWTALDRSCRCTAAGSVGARMPGALSRTRRDRGARRAPRGP